MGKYRYAVITDDLLSLNKLKMPKLPIPADESMMIAHTRDLIKKEKELAESIAMWSANHPVRQQYLDKIQGIGPIFSSALIAALSPISRFNTVTQLWSYAGLGTEHWESECKKGHKIITTNARPSCPVRGKNMEPCGAPIVKSQHVSGIPKRKSGYVLYINTNLKTLMYKIASSFEKMSANKSQYRAMYEVKKQQYYAKLTENMSTVPSGIKAHARLMALRYVEKMFLSHLFTVWRTIEGLETPMPYAIAVLGHPKEDYEPPKVDKGRLVLTPTVVPPVAVSQIKQLIGQYYDIQKLRIKAFNNVNAYVKDHVEEILAPLPYERKKKYLKPDDEPDEPGDDYADYSPD